MSNPMGTTRIQRIAQVTHLEQVADAIFILRFESEAISESASPGQFVNIRLDNSCSPLLRRPFSISRVLGVEIELLFNVVGRGTQILASKQIGDELDVLGPLGMPLKISGEFETALLVAGGVGVAPFPFLTSILKNEGKKIVTFLGARTESQLVLSHLENIQIATDDGSRGFQGTVVALLREYFHNYRQQQAKIFGCGPMNMLKALSDFAKEANIDCELSLEGEMACGIGLCQGCVVKRANGKKKYALVCSEGPAFNSKEIVLK